MTASLQAAGAPSAHLAASPTSGTAPLVVGFDSARSSAGTIAEHLLLLGNGDAISLGMAEQTTNYNYTLPGFYLAQTWLRDGSGVALSPPVPISVLRERDGLAPPTGSATVGVTTDPATFAFTATLMPQPSDPIAAQRWSFGDGIASGEAAPFHTYAQPGIYQAALLATTQAGMPLRARLVVVVGANGGMLPPSLLLTASPEDASVLTPVTVSAFVEGVAPDAMIASAEVVWPDLVDASPTLTPTMAGITVTSQHAIAQPGSYDVAVTVHVMGQTAALTASLPITVGNIDDSSPSPAVLMAPSSTAVVGVPYAPGEAGPAAAALLVAGDGPFAFGAAMPSPRNFSVDAHGRIAWTPTRDQLGVQRLALRIVDAQGRETVESRARRDLIAGGPARARARERLEQAAGHAEEGEVERHGPLGLRHDGLAELVGGCGHGEITSNEMRACVATDGSGDCAGDLRGHRPPRPA
ncbi:MAG: PKD domain-containing protein [Polyangia bacterium]